jgi:hypothetical protein
LCASEYDIFQSLGIWQVTFSRCSLFCLLENESGVIAYYGWERVPSNSHIGVLLI